MSTLCRRRAGLWARKGLFYFFVEFGPFSLRVHSFHYRIFDTKLKTHAGPLQACNRCAHRKTEMAVTKEQVESTLKSKLNPSHLDVIDTSGGCGASYKIEIVSEQFEGKRLLERHRMINGALVEEMKQIHALSIAKALTPEQWKQEETQKSQAAA